MQEAVSDCSSRQAGRQRAPVSAEGHLRDRRGTCRGLRSGGPAAGPHPVVSVACLPD